MPGPCWRVLESHENDGRSSALALRFLGAVHRLVLEGRAPELARYYPSMNGLLPANEAWPAFREAVEKRKLELRDLVNHPVQTNEVGRSCALMGGFLLAARGTRLPLRLLEIGARAGLNLRWDQYESRSAHNLECRNRRYLWAFERSKSQCDGKN